MSSPEKRLWNETIGMEVVRRGPDFDQIQRLNTVFDDCRKALPVEDWNGVKCQVIPATTFRYNSAPSDKEPEYKNGKAFFARPTSLKTKVGTGLFAEREEPYMFAFIDPDTDDPGRYALKFDVLTGTVTGMNEDYSIDPPPAEVMSEVIREAVYRAEPQARTLEERRVSRRNRRFGIAATWLSIATLVAGGGYAVDRKLDSDRAEERRREEARTAFDRSDFRIEGGEYRISQGTVVQLPADEFNRIPSYRKGDTLSDARRFKLEENDCRTLTTKVNETDVVHLAVRRDEAFKDEPFAFSRTKAGSLVICSLGNFKGADGENSVSLALQVR